MKLNGDRSVAERRTGASSKSLRDSDRASFSINVEFLDKCSFHCPGCFVKRRNTATQEDLDVLNHLAAQLSEREFEVDEILLGPTDLFGCMNAIDLLKDPKFLSVFDHFNALTFTSTLLGDTQHIKNTMDVINELYGPKAYVEIIVVFDMDAYARNDRKYIETFERNLELVADCNLIFAFNIHTKGLFSQVEYAKISEEVNLRYNSHLKMVPSFFRSQKTSKIMENLFSWRDELQENINNEESTTILNNMVDTNFGGYTYFVYTFKDGHLFANHYTYDFNFEDNNSLLVPKRDDGFYYLDDLFEFERQNIQQQFKYAASTEECNNCRYLPSCVGKKVLSFMENRGIMKCFLPKETMDYNNRVE